MAAGKADILKEGIDMAGEAIDSGSAADKLQLLIRFTSRNSPAS